MSQLMYIALMLAPVIFGCGLYNYVVCLVKQQQILERTTPNHRGINPGLVWLQLIPGLNLIVSYLAAWHVAEAIERTTGVNQTAFGSATKTMGFLTAHAAILFAVSVWWGSEYYFTARFLQIALAFLWLIILRKYVRRLIEAQQAMPAYVFTGSEIKPSSTPSLRVAISTTWSESKRRIRSITPLNFLITLSSRCLGKNPYTRAILLLCDMALVCWLLAVLFDFWRLDGILTSQNIYYTFVIYCVVLWCFGIKSQYNALKKIGPAHRTIHPGYVWWQTIPLFNFIFSYLMSWHVVWSVKTWQNEHGGKFDHSIEDIGTIICHSAIVLCVGVFLQSIRMFPFNDPPVWLLLAIMIFWTLLVRQYIRALNSAIQPVQQAKTVQGKSHA